MAGTLHLASGNTSAIGINATNFTYACGYVLNFASETRAQIAWRTMGAFSNLYARVKTNGLTTAAATVTFRKNAGAGNQTISVGAGLTGEFEDVTNTDTNTGGDLIDYQIVTANSGSGTLVIGAMGVQFQAAASTVARIAATSPKAYTTAAQTAFNSLAGNLANQLAVEAGAQFKAKTTATFQNLQANVAVNTRTDTNTLRMRKNTANGNQVISILTLTTGIFEDNVNTDGVVTGDLVNYQLVTGADAAHSITLEAFSIEMFSLTGTSHAVTGGRAATDAANLTVFDAIGGFRNSETTEANVQAQANYGYTASRLETFVIANGITAASTITFRKNAGAGNQTISIASGLTGYFEDAVNQDVILATDEINYQYVLGATGTTSQLGFIGHLITGVPIGFHQDIDSPKFDRPWAAVPYF